MDTPSVGHSPVVIRAESLSKVYRLGETPLLRLRAALGLPAGRALPEHRALDGVSFSIHRGETVGLLGVNGAGKSTLLQLITGTLQPSSGTVETAGQISALLELGAGFNPEWSGRRNAEFQCVLRGVRTPELAPRLEAIETFADIGDYFDQPARTYSSGMFVRVAFAAAIATEPDILIVDEALAVGDMRFQNKCFRRFEELQSTGCTILFVTHAPDLVTRFCTRGMILDRGRVVMDGDVQEAVKAYYQLTVGAASRPASAAAAPAAEVDAASPAQVLGAAVPGEPVAAVIDAEPPGAPASPRRLAARPRPREGRLEQRALYNALENRSGSGGASILDAVAHFGDFAEIVAPIPCGSRVTVTTRIAVHAGIVAPEHGLIIRSATGQILAGASNRILHKHDESITEAGVISLDWRMELDLLRGDYFIDLGIAELDGGARQVLDLRQSCLHLQVSDVRGIFGLVDVNFDLALVSETG